MKFLRLFPLFLTALVLCGCESKSHARAQARAESRAAFAAGEAKAYREMLGEKKSKVQIVGNVLTHEMTWESGMTLAGLLVVAEYQGADSPHEIVILRGTDRIPVDVRTLLNGEDIPIEAGDTVEIHE